MQAFARFALPSGRIVEVGPGDIIGRLRGAALRIDDPRISEAHALVSLRGDALKLLALRGRFMVEGVAASEVTLKPGLEVRFTPELTLTVVSVALPSVVFALDGDGLARQVLPPVASLDAKRPELVAGFSSDADALLWSDGEGYRLRRTGHPDTDLVAGAEFRLGTRTFRLVELPLARLGVQTTAKDPHTEELVLVLRYDNVHVRRGPNTDVIDGVPARIITELALIRAPIEWRSLAHELWGDDGDDEALRDRWDGALSRLRKRLRELGLRADLVRTDGRGKVELFLGARDRLVDET